MSLGRACGILWLSGAVLQLCCARQAYQARIPNGDRVQYRGQPWPGVGHGNAAGGGVRNSFGTQFEQEGLTWTADLCRADSDGDGYSNGQELGDPLCVWRVGGIPSRSTDISHPGIYDSTPAGVYPTSYPTPSPGSFQLPTPSPTSNPMLTPTPSVVGPGGTPGTATGGVLSPGGRIEVTRYATTSCTTATSTVRVTNADGICRQVTNLQGGATQYAAAYCDISAGKVYYNAGYATMANCIASVGSLQQLRYDPGTVRFELQGRGCVAAVINGVARGFRLTSSTCSQGTPTSPGAISPPIPPPVIGRLGTPNPTFRSGDATTADDDSSVKTWMIVVLCLILVALFVCCGLYAVARLRKRHLLKSRGKWGGPMYPGPPGDDTVVHHAPLPSGPPQRALQELETVGKLHGDPPPQNPIPTEFRS